MATLPSLNGLRAFEAAARRLSFTLAAAELNVTQTAISHQIRRLEDQLGIRLFERRNRGLALTREAQGYLPSVRAAFDDLRQATARLQRPGRDELLVVSTTASLAAKWLVTRMAAFQDAHPGIEVRITTSAHLVDFRREQVDMAVRYGRGNWAGLRAQWLMAEDIFPVCSPALLNAAKPLRRPEDLAHHTLLHATVSREDQSFMATQAAMEGLGVALGRTPYVETDIAAGRLVVPFDVVLPADAGFYIVAPDDTFDTPKIALFRDWLIGSVAPGAVAPPPDLPPAQGRPGAA
jgi:LysR family transcriptional regulator, glycine cleavage system transcriptional activator